MRQWRACCFNILSNHNVTHLKLENDKIAKIERVQIPLKILTNSHSYQKVNRIKNQFLIFFVSCVIRKVLVSIYQTNKFIINI